MLKRTTFSTMTIYQTVLGRNRMKIFLKMRMKSKKIIILWNQNRQTIIFK